VGAGTSCIPPPLGTTFKAGRSFFLFRRGGVFLPPLKIPPRDVVPFSSCFRPLFFPVNLPFSGRTILPFSFSHRLHRLPLGIGITPLFPASISSDFHRRHHVFLPFHRLQRRWRPLLQEAGSPHLRVLFRILGIVHSSSWIRGRNLFLPLKGTNLGNLTIPLFRGPSFLILFLVASPFFCHCFGTGAKTFCQRHGMRVPFLLQLPP